MNMSISKNVFSVFVMLAAIFGGISVARAQTGASSASTPDVLGYAWSDGAGWISMSCQDGGPAASDICGAVNYGVQIDASGNMTGYGWSDNLGWIKFGGLSGFPAGGLDAHYDSISGNISGFARFCSGMSGSSYFAINNTCTGASRTDGWDGWLSLSGKNPSYGVMIGGNGVFSGFAWGNEVVGWTDFSAVKLSTATGNESIAFDVGKIPLTGNQGVQYVPAPYMVTTPSGPTTLTLFTSQKLFWKWNTVGATSCTFSGVSSAGAAVPSGAGSMNLSAGTGYILALTCNMASGGTMTKSAIVDVIDEGVVIDQDMSWYAANPTQVFTKAAFRYESFGTSPQSCKAYSSKPGSAGPVYVTGFPVGGYTSSLGGIIPPYAQIVSAWSPTTTITYNTTTKLASGNIVLNRESVDTRYYLECVGKTSGKYLADSEQTGPIETIPLTLVATEPGTQNIVTQVNVGDKVDLTWSANSSNTFNSCSATADINGAGIVAGPFATSTTSGTSQPAPTSPSYAETSSNVSVPAPSGKSVHYQILCMTSYGYIGIGDATVAVNGTANLDLTYKSSNGQPLLHNVGGQKIDLSWAHPSPSLFGVKACYTDAKVVNVGGVLGNPNALPTGGSWDTSTSWDGQSGLMSPDGAFWQASVMNNIAVPNVPSGTSLVYSIHCKDTTGADHIASVPVTLTDPATPISTLSLAATCDPVAETFVMSWTSSNVSRCTELSQNTHPVGTWQWLTGTGVFGLIWQLTPGSVAPDNQTLSGSSSPFPLTLLPKSFNVQCADDTGAVVKTSGILITYDPSTGLCSVKDSKPKKPRFEEF